MTTPSVRTVHGTLLVDAEHVVIDTDQGEHVLTAEEPSPMWSWARGASVDATLRDVRGRPPHIESLRVKGEGSVAYRDIGPIESMRGAIVIEDGAPGTKRERTRTAYFETDTGERFGVMGGDAPTSPTPTKVRVRRLTADMSFTARDTEVDVYFVR